ncbi:MAG: hypothetical protein U5K00_00160 [Melioribacteraceae bacterium]|nr:hypothetical protein [Melioribacteraceae bacterium]
MNVSANEVAKKIEKLKSTLPKVVLEKQYQLQPHLRKEYTERHEKLYLEDTAYHLSYLSEAVRSEEPKLFTEYIKWAKAFFKELPVKEEDLITNLEIIKGVMAEEMPGEMHQTINKLLDLGIEIFRSEQHDISSYLIDENPLKAEAEEYLTCLISGDKKRAVEIILGLYNDGITIKDIYQNIFGSDAKRDRQTLAV